MSEPKYKPGDRVKFKMQFADTGSQPVIVTGEVANGEATVIGDDTYYRVNTEMGIAILMREDNLING